MSMEKDLEAKIKELEARVKVLEDIEAIKKMKAKTDFTVDKRDWDGFLKLFARECSGEYPGGIKCPTRQDVEKFFREVVDQTATWMLHYHHNPYIDVEGDTARAIWYWTAPTVGIDGKARWTAGKGDDVYVREDGGWKHRENNLTVFYMCDYDDPEGWANKCEQP